MNISQVMVYARGDAVTNKARGKAVTGCGHATWGSAIRNITDGNEGNRSYKQGLSLEGASPWVQVDLSSTTDIQRIVVITTSGNHDRPATYNYVLMLVDASGQQTTYTCNFNKAMRSGICNGTYTFDLF